MALTSKVIVSFIQVGKHGSKMAMVDADKNNATEISKIVEFPIKWYQLALNVVCEFVKLLWKLKQFSRIKENEKKAAVLCSYWIWI